MCLSQSQRGKTFLFFQYSLRQKKFDLRWIRQQVCVYNTYKYVRTFERIHARMFLLHSLARGQSTPVQPTSCGPEKSILLQVPISVYVYVKFWFGQNGGILVEIDKIKLNTNCLVFHFFFLFYVIKLQVHELSYLYDYVLYKSVTEYGVVYERTVYTRTLV